MKGAKLYTFASDDSSARSTHRSLRRRASSCASKGRHLAASVHWKLRIFVDGRDNHSSASTGAPTSLTGKILGHTYSRLMLDGRRVVLIDLDDRAARQSHDRGKQKKGESHGSTP
jgi:hypothetical protein